MNDAFGERESTRPSALKSHAYARRSPFASVEPAPENCTVNGGFKELTLPLAPAAGTVVILGTGVRSPPRTKSTRLSCASGVSKKNPSPYSSVYIAPSGPNSMSIGLSRIRLLPWAPENRLWICSRRSPFGSLSSNTFT